MHFALDTMMLDWRAVGVVVVIQDDGINFPSVATRGIVMPIQLANVLHVNMIRGVPLLRCGCGGGGLSWCDGRRGRGTSEHGT